MADPEIQVGFRMLSNWCFEWLIHLCNSALQSIMSDPMMQQVLRDLSTDANAAQKVLQFYCYWVFFTFCSIQHMRDPGVAGKIEKLIAAGVLQVG
jgi:hypothetical protein